MKFSIIGTGFILPAHVLAIRDIGGEIIDIVNDSHSPDAWKEMIRNTVAECIVILTPNDLHFDMAMMAAENRKIVLCEKPLTITSIKAQELTKRNNVFTVLQLRHHPFIEKIKSEIHKDGGNEVNIDISVYRDSKYYAGWKGKAERSGGLLFNLGIHYFDLLLHLFGEAKKASVQSLSDKVGEGTIEGTEYLCRWRISTDEKRETQHRIFKVNGVDYNFSNKDNLSYENLHRFVYEDLTNGKGITPDEALKSITLVENLYEAAK